MPQRLAYLPLNTYPEAAPDPAILAAAGFAAALGCGLEVSAFAVDVPPTASPIGGYFFNVESLARSAEERSAAECARLQALVQEWAAGKLAINVTLRKAMLGAALDAAAAEARLHDLAVLPWAADTLSAQDMAQALVFGAGVPVILVPQTARAASVGHMTIAWDGSRVAARALGDALPLLAAGGRVTVVTVTGEKALGTSGLATALVASLQRRGYSVEAASISLAGRPIATALQETALASGADLLAMGGFGHSRLRDFILGGATKGVFADLRLPVLLSH
ncbi:MAG: universal stress protein UspA [Rhodobacterales bacterium 12-65-15]|nr:MAG: universal stress protein UspA [Rhodobacterales bacterium 12-65-15]